MRFQYKIAVLSAVLITDLLFFLFFRTYYPEILEYIYRWLPWENNLEKTILVVAGFIIAALSSSAIISLLARALQKLIQGKHYET